ncbi:porin [Burkholderia pseudomultivorans]|uniref:Outer membrane porin protein n=1 Tax=Burkholderia pseudomultivorans TaxID=1207504 RepID=A0ABU2DW05_9BURK|nr:porin [Burkholderia pseudomultivorans]MDR8730105.1 Outer membrane porin protein [Burkholderia pseudomultivorans]MDR8734690.1 Outer membrane porin protein [Burkholderia pseudomultivorans]MDR8740656.1 Outer membrane porin protein [Burkholderia pseudomultivorans]MDR8751679.1 Outer membrane porin protein [Burkholderia pseudomultivorans]MDR8777070.1 Outer membrane porin protein [Burkholderia pseudomultivorans]
MKKNLVALTAMSVLFPPAHAQSSVTLFGVVDDALTINTNAKGARQTSLTSGAMGSPRWGLKGTEDLGGGLKSLFWIEGGFSTNTGALGQGGDLFGRQAKVGLTHDAWGTLTLGRQYSAGYQLIGPMTSGGSFAFSGAGFGTHPADLDNLDSTYRVNNAIIYRTPQIRGFTGMAMYSMGGIAGAAGERQIWALGAQYLSGPVTLGMGYQQSDRPNFSVNGVNPSASSTGLNMTSPVNQGYASAGVQKTFAAGASYNFGKGTVAAIFSNSRYMHLGSTAVAGLPAVAAGYTGTASFNIGELNARYYVSPVLMLGAAYAYTRASGVNSATYQQVNAVVDYFFSKRTDIYAGGVFQRASGTNSLGEKAVAAINGATASSSNRQLVAVIGIGHRF